MTDRKLYELLRIRAGLYDLVSHMRTCPSGYRSRVLMALRELVPPESDFVFPTLGSALWENAPCVSSREGRLECGELKFVSGRRKLRDWGWGTECLCYPGRYAETEPGVTTGKRLGWAIASNNWWLVETTFAVNDGGDQSPMSVRGRSVSDGEIDLALPEVPLSFFFGPVLDQVKAWQKDLDNKLEVTIHLIAALEPALVLARMAGR